MIPCFALFCAGAELRAAKSLLQLIEPLCKRVTEILRESGEIGPNQAVVCRGLPCWSLPDIMLAIVEESEEVASMFSE